MQQTRRRHKVLGRTMSDNVVSMKEGRFQAYQDEEMSEKSCRGSIRSFES